MYDPEGIEWAYFHQTWSGTSQIQFYDFKDHLFNQFKETEGSPKRIMRVEELVLDYVSIGRCIQNNDFTMSSKFYLRCQHCKQDMVIFLGK